MTVDRIDPEVIRAGAEALAALDLAEGTFSFDDNSLAVIANTL